MNRLKCFVIVNKMEFIVLFIGFTLLIRIVWSLLFTMEKYNNYRREYNFFDLWVAYFLSLNQLGNWFPFFLGTIELFCYPIFIASENLSFIGAWIGFKTLAQWKVWSETRRPFNRYLICNALVLIFSFILSAWIRA